MQSDGQKERKPSADEGLDGYGATLAQTAGSRSGSRIWLFIFLIGLVCLIGYIVFTPRETPLGKAINLVKSNKAALAVPLLEDLYKQNPAETAVYPWLAQGYLATDRVAEGRTALDTAFRVNCHDDTLPAVVDNYSVYYQNRGHFAEAERLYASALAVVAADKLGASRGRMYLKWSQADMASGDLASAVSHLTSASQFAQSLEEPLRSQVPHRLAECYRQLGALAETVEKDDKKAVQLLEKSVSVSDEPATRVILGGLYSRLKNQDKALENYQIVARLDGNNLEVRHRLIEILLDKKRIEEARDALSELVDKEKSFENYELLANLNLKLVNYAGAVRALEEACSLRPKSQLLKQLLSTLNNWSASLTAQNKTQEAMSVKGHAERVEEQLAELLKEEHKDDVKPETQAEKWSPGTPPVSVIASRNWLVKGSLTPEGEIRIKNVSGQALSDLTLNAVFYDNTRRRSNGSVLLPVASPTSNPFAPGEERTLYFSCPNIVKEDHQLAVIILWKGKFLREFPVVKQR